MSEESVFQKFRKVRLPIKIWILTHPFVARKAWQLTEESLKIAESEISDSDLDGDFSGGQVDAFRHVFWMAYLTQNIGSRKALKLGTAHEKSNEIDFRKRAMEENYLPTFVACKMDYLNNETGAKIGLENPNLKKEDLIVLVKKTVFGGKTVMIKKNKIGQFLDSEGKIIPEKEYIGLWHTSKTIIESNFKRPE
jgi:hypothetical protein